MGEKCNVKELDTGQWVVLIVSDIKAACSFTDTFSLIIEPNSVPWAFLINQIYVSPNQCHLLWDLLLIVCVLKVGAKICLRQFVITGTNVTFFSTLILLLCLRKMYNLFLNTRTEKETLLFFDCNRVYFEHRRWKTFVRHLKCIHGWTSKHTKEVTTSA